MHSLRILQLALTDSFRKVVCDALTSASVLWWGELCEKKDSHAEHSFLVDGEDRKARSNGREPKEKKQNKRTAPHRAPGDAVRGSPATLGSFF